MIPTVSERDTPRVAPMQFHPHWRFDPKRLCLERSEKN